MNKVHSAYNSRGVLFNFTLSNTRYKGVYFTTLKGESYIVLGEFLFKSRKRYLIEFEDGTQIVSSSVGENQNIKNPNSISVYGIGILGVGSFSRKNHPKEYSSWRRMLQRCYNLKTQERQPTYKGCSVDKRWHNFQNFCEDIVHLENYELWKNNTKKCAWALDKDIKIKGNKIYSKDTCKFASWLENNDVGNRVLESDGYTYIGTHIKTNKTVEFKNKSSFAREYNLDSSHIGDCINGLRKTHKGWKFSVKDYNV